MDFRIRQLKRALEPLREALESHHRSLEGLESALIEFEETFNEPEQRQQRPLAQPGAGSLNLLSIPDVPGAGDGQILGLQAYTEWGDTLCKARAQHKGQARRSRRVPGGPALPANVRISPLSSSRTL